MIKTKRLYLGILLTIFSASSMTIELAQQIVTLQNNGNSEEAINLARKDIEQNPKDAYAWSIGGWVFLNDGQWDKSISYSTKALSFEGISTKLKAVTLLQRGDAYQEKMAYDQAIADYSEGITITSQIPELFTGRADALRFQKKYEEAVADYSQSILLDSTLESVYSNRGDSYFKLGRYENTVTDYSKALTFDSTNIVYYSQRGNAELFLGRLDKAKADYTKLLSIDSTSAVTWTSVSWICCLQKKYSEAITAGQKALACDSTFYGAHGNIGHAYLMLKDDENAVKQYDLWFANSENSSPTALLNQDYSDLNKAGVHSIRMKKMIEKYSATQQRNNR